MVNITELANEVRAEAADIVNRHQKLASLNLYRVLARCLEVAEHCTLSVDAQQEMRRLVASEAPPGKRSYVETRSDEYVLVCRYVLKGEDYANLSRYSNALREAKKLQLHSSELYEWLKHKGGVQALYLRRPSIHQVVNAKLIRLDRTITFPKLGAFTMILERTEDGTFTVIEEPHAIS